MDTIVKITVSVPDQKALQEILSAGKVHHDCGSPKRDNQGNYLITLFATPEVAEKIAKLPYRTEVDKDYGEVLKMRQKEVSAIDRFEGGKIKPKGLGIKK